MYRLTFIIDCRRRVTFCCIILHGNFRFHITRDLQQFQSVRHFLTSLVAWSSAGLFKFLPLSSKNHAHSFKLGLHFQLMESMIFSRPGRTIPRMVDSPAVIDLLFDTSWTRRLCQPKIRPWLMKSVVVPPNGDKTWKPSQSYQGFFRADTNASFPSAKDIQQLQHDDFSGLRLRPTWFQPPHQRPASSAILCTVKLKLWMGLRLLSKGFQSGSRLFSQMGKWWKWDDIWWLIFEGLLQLFDVSSEPKLCLDRFGYQLQLPGSVAELPGLKGPESGGEWWKVGSSAGWMTF